LSAVYFIAIGVNDDENKLSVLKARL